MNIYDHRIIWLVYFCQVLISILIYKKNKKIKMSFLIIQIGFFSVYFGLRPINVGTDTFNYINSYFFKDSSLDFGLKMLNSMLFSIVGKNQFIYLTTINFLIILNISLIIKNILDDFKCINFVFLLTMSMPYVILMNINIIRQGFAASIILLGFTLVFVKDRKIGWAFALFGVLFHYSMILLFVFFLLIRFLKLDSNMILILSIIIVILNYSGFSNIIINMIPFEYLRVRFSQYLLMHSGTSFLLKLFFYFSNYYLIRIFVINKCTNKSKFLLELMSSIILSAVFLINSELSSSRYLIIAELILPVFYFMQIENIKEKSIYSILLVMSFLIYFMAFTLSNSYNINFPL